jgi:hypothetical protein
MTVSPSLHSLRRRFAGKPETAYKQIGLRAVRDALALQGRNPARIAELTAIAAHQADLADAALERDRARRAF